MSISITSPASSKVPEAPSPAGAPAAPAPASSTHTSTHTSAPAIGVAGLLGRPYRTIRLEWTSDLRLLRVRLCVRPIQCYSLAAMGELQQVFNDLTANPGLARHFVLSSDVPKVFKIGRAHV